jgi:hypothetical protein
MTHKKRSLFPDESILSYLETEHAMKFDSFTRRIAYFVKVPENGRNCIKLA